MKDNHGFEKIGYVPPKKNELSSRDSKKITDGALTLVIVLVFIILAVVLFVYPGYFIRIFSETGYNFMN